MANIAAIHCPYFPVRRLLLDKFESWRYAPKVTAPAKMIAAQNDEIIPLASTESLHKRLPRSLTTLTVINGVGHNDISDSREYVRLLAETRN